MRPFNTKERESGLSVGSEVPESVKSYKKKRYEKPAHSVGMIDSDDEYDGKCYVLDDHDPNDIPESDFFKFMERSRRSTADKDLRLDSDEVEESQIDADVPTAVAPAGEAGDPTSPSWNAELLVGGVASPTSLAGASESAEDEIAKSRKLSSSSEAGASKIASLTASTSTFLTSSPSSYWSVFPSDNYPLFGPITPTSSMTTLTPAKSDKSISTVSKEESKPMFAKLESVTSTKSEVQALDKSEKKVGIVKKISSPDKTPTRRFDIPKFENRKAKAIGIGKSSTTGMWIERISGKRN